MDLTDLAARIPSMGGTEIGPLLRHVAGSAPADTSIVEVGCWLGAGTAQLALGIQDRQSDGHAELHCYDRWQANEAEVEKAAHWDVALVAGQDTLPDTRRTLAPFDVPVVFHKGDITDADWDGGPISVYVDDASKKWQAFYHVLFTFGPHWIPGKTVVVLMDYNIWKSTGAEEHQVQKQFIEAHGDCFQPIDYVGQSSTKGRLPTQPAAFLYTQPVDFRRWVATTSMARLGAAQQEVKSLTNEVRRRDEKLAQLRRSTSWRVTAPLRRMADATRTLRGGAPTS